jgi:N-formylglutamate amidohydrolase
MDHQAQALILHIPHAATTIPLRDGYVVDDAALLAEQLLLTDWHTDELFANATDSAIVAPFSRVFCDVERFADDAHEVMAGVGMGVLYERSDAGLPLRSVSPELRERVLQEYYRPHHHRLTAAVDAQLQQHGQATLVDCHSFPALPLRRDLDQQLPRPDFNFGTDAFHTPQELIERATAYFAQAGYSLGVDRPYRGTLVPMVYYQRDARVRSIMLEVNRDLYLQSGTNIRNARFDAIKGVVQGFLDAMR